jgi:hypothetical protein
MKQSPCLCLSTTVYATSYLIDEQFQPSCRVKRIESGAGYLMHAGHIGGLADARDRSMLLSL